MTEKPRVFLHIMRKDALTTSAPFPFLFRPSPLCGSDNKSQLFHSDAAHRLWALARRGETSHSLGWL